MKSFLISLLMIGGMWGQNSQPNTNYRKVVSNQGAAGSTAIGPIITYGQAVHQFLIVYKDNGLTRCDTYRQQPVSIGQPKTAVMGRVTLEPLVDPNNQNFLPTYTIAVNVPDSLYSTAGMRASRLVGVNANFPFLYLGLFDHYFTQCLVDVYYQGSNVPPVIPSEINGYAAEYLSPQVSSSWKTSTTTLTPGTYDVTDFSEYASNSLKSIMVANNNASAGILLFEEIYGPGAITPSRVITRMIAPANNQLNLDLTNRQIQVSVGSKIRLTYAGPSVEATFITRYE